MIATHPQAGRAKLAEMIARSSDPPKVPHWLAKYLTIAHDRLLIAADSLAGFLEPESRILDVGGNEQIQEVLEGIFQRKLDYHWTNHLGFDLREHPLPHPDESFDVVLCWETIEHLWSIVPGGTVSWDGVLHACREMRRVLRPGGHFHLTTTNRVCPRTFANFVRGEEGQIKSASWGNEGHIREFSGPELLRMARETGFENAQATSFNGYGLHFGEDKVKHWRPRMEKAFGRQLRGDEVYDTLLMVATKPA